MDSMRYTQGYENAKENTNDREAKLESAHWNKWAVDRPRGN